MSVEIYQGFLLLFCLLSSKIFILCFNERKRLQIDQRCSI